MTRRQLLQRVALAGAFQGTVLRAGEIDSLGRRQKERAAGGVKRMKMRSALDSIDHLLLGAADLDRAIEWFQARTGVKPEFGGVHPGRGTRNALASLGRRHYLEIIAPHPAQKELGFQIDLRKLAAPKLVNWAVASDDVDAAASAAKAAKYAVFGPDDGARTRPDGSTLLWRTVGVLAPFRNDEVDPMPFFIQWGRDVKHPSEDSPAGCRLASFELHHPDADALRSTLVAFGIDAVVTKSARPGLTAVLDTPKGRVTL